MSQLTSNDNGINLASPSACPMSHHPSGWTNRFFRGKLISHLEKLEGGAIRLVDSQGEIICGNPASTTSTIQVHDPRFYRRVALGGGLSAAESYIDRDWSTDNLPTLLQLFARNLETTAKLNGRYQWMANLWQRAQTFGHKNSLLGSRRNIAAHYDLSNDFFRLWLDGTMTYSSALWPTEDATLAEASTNKYDNLCRQLDLQPGDRVLEIGTGWGGFTQHAVQNYGVHVTTTTISKQQHDYAAERFRISEIEDRVDLLEMDYRNLMGQYDKVVSIEMIEAVGEEFLPTYFQVCNDRLKPGGKFGLQAILMPDHRYASYRQSTDFIQKHIFPGGMLPSIGSISQAIAKRTSLVMDNFHEFGFDYARTLEEWRDAMYENLSEIQKLGFDDRFIRLWDYYLCFCRAGFLERKLNVAQIFFRKV